MVFVVTGLNWVVMTVLVKKIATQIPHQVFGLQVQIVQMFLALAVHNDHDWNGHV